MRKKILTNMICIKRNSKLVILTFSLIALLFSCLKIDVASEIPFLQYKSMDLYKGKDKLGNDVFNVHITASFEDGDGDVGYPETDTTQSLFLNVFKIKGGVHVDSTVEIGYRIPYIEPVKSVRIVKGEVELTHELKTTEYSENDSVVFEMYMFDRSMNQSNVITTPKALLEAN
jgi:hypothetical protein